MTRQTDHPVLRKNLLVWYESAARKLPWRDTGDPWRIWVSEVMLQQTRVNTVIPYYRSFVKRFPSPAAMAAADLDCVLKAWEGLGYYARARNLHAAAGRVVRDHNGEVPRDPELFRALPGVGDYINAAVLSIAFGEPLAVVDGNVKRVLARLFEIDVPVNKSSGAGVFHKTAEALLERDDPGTFNQAVMELGALVCTPASPACDNCPLAARCGARLNSRQNQLPVRAPRKPIPAYRVAVGVVQDRDRVLITRRKPEGLLGGMWEFPGGKLEDGEQSGDACFREVKEETGLEVEVGEHVARVDHAYTHFKVTLDVFRCRYRGGDVVLDGPVDYRWVTLEQIDDYPVPAASHKILFHLRSSGG
jgi:A/G-specific adenine glycosylase